MASSIMQLSMEDWKWKMGSTLSPWSGHRYHNIYAYDNGNVRRFSLSGYYGRPSSGIVAPTVAAAETRIECCRGRALNMR